MIIAIETTNEDGKPEIAINPQEVKIKNATVGSVLSSKIGVNVEFSLPGISLHRTLKK